MLSQHRAARMIPIAALLIAALVACSDSSIPTAPLALHPSFTQVAATPVVNSLNDPGTGTCDDTECTLREAIVFASSGATITFSVSGTIVLSGAYLSINKNLTISGPGATELAVSGDRKSRVFDVGSGTVTISGLTITGGYSPSVGGAAILNWTNLTVIDCAITGNDAFTAVGGGIRNYYGTLLVVSSTISGNTGHQSSAGVYSNTPTSVTFVNSTISGNRDPSGDTANGIYNYAGTLRVDHSTVTGHTIGVSVYQGSAIVKGSLIWGNASHDIDEYSTGLYTSLGHNLIGTASSTALLTEFTETGDQTGITNAPIDTLALNSPGHTRTHALLTGSPAIDVGTCTNYADATVSTDQRGVSRPQGSACDIGAYELQTSGGTTPAFTFDLSLLPAKTYGDGSFSVYGYTSTNSTGAITFATGAGSVGCSVSDSIVTITGAAINPSACILEASLAADATYTSAGPLQQSFNIAKAAGSVSINNIPASATVGGSFTPAYTKSGDGTASTVSNSPSICTVTSGVVSYIAAGSCLLEASVTEGTDHLAVTASEQNFTISLAAPTFGFDLSALSPKTYGDGSFSVATYATTNSTGAITFDLGAGSTGCSVTSAGMVTITGAAVDPVHCVLAATLAADATYASAGPIKDSVNVAKAAGSVSINNMPTSGSVSGQFTPAFTKVGDGTASVASLTQTVCTVSEGVVSFIAAGDCTLQASVTAGTNHLAATGGEQSFTVSLGTPTFGFNLSTLPTKTYGDDSFSVASYATTNSTGAITFALGTGSVGCSVTSAGMVTIDGAAVDPSHCVLAATLAADGSYAAAGPIEQSFNISRAAGSVSINNMPGSATISGTFTPEYTKAGDGSASVVSLTTSVCTVTDGVVSFIAAGTCTLQASVAEGTNHLAATGSEQGVNVVPATGIFSSACTFTINPKNNQRQVTVSWDNANPGVTKIEITDGRIVTKQLAPTSLGSWTTNVKTGTPAYGLWGGESRRDFATNLVPAGTACVLQ